MISLLFTTGSPYARAVRIVLDELSLDYERREEITTPSVEKRAAASPTLQVPTLWDGDLRLWESGLISEYLLHTYQDRLTVDPPLAARAWRSDFEWRDKLVLSTVQTLGSVVTTVSQMKWSGVSVDENSHLTRCADRLPHLLGWLEAELVDGQLGFLPGCVSLQDVFVACHIRFAQNRPLGLDLELTPYPKLSRLLDQLDRRESFRSNPIWWWEPGVTGYEKDGTPVYS